LKVLKVLLETQILRLVVRVLDLIKQVLLCLKVFYQRLNQTMESLLNSQIEQLVSIED